MAPPDTLVEGHECNSGAPGDVLALCLSHSTVRVTASAVPVEASDELRGATSQRYGRMRLAVSPEAWRSNASYCRLLVQPSRGSGPPKSRSRRDRGTPGRPLYRVSAALQL